MLEKILLAVDDSDHSRKTIPAVVELVRAGGGTVRVLHVREVPFAAVTVGDTPEEAQQLVTTVVDELKQQGVTAESLVRNSIDGSPARTILEQAGELGAGLIVLGSRGLSDLGGLLLGSVAHKVLQLATCPVLVVRDQDSLQERHHDVLRA